MLASVFILFEILGILSSIHAVLQPRTSQGAIAWIVCLITLPVVAVPAYWIFGRSRMGPGSGSGTTGDFTLKFVANLSNSGHYC